MTVFVPPDWKKLPVPDAPMYSKPLTTRDPDESEYDPRPPGLLPRNRLEAELVPLDTVLVPPDWIKVPAPKSPIISKPCCSKRPTDSDPDDREYNPLLPATSAT